ncbi:TPA: hypothetical protein ACIE75_005481, partial [Klebsiella pneumoniae]
MFRVPELIEDSKAAIDYAMRHILAWRHYVTWHIWSRPARGRLKRYVGVAVFSMRAQVMDRSIRVYKALIWLTLYGATLHFFDNVYFFNQYPEPAWLTAGVVGALWIPVALLAHRAVDYIYNGKVDRSYSVVHGYVFANWISLGHYLFGSPAAILPRINFAI